MLDSHACGHLNAFFDNGFILIAAKLLQASFYRTHQSLGRAHINPGGMQLSHVHKRSATSSNLLLPELTDIEFPVADSSKSLVTVPRNARERSRQTFFATETAHHTRQATIRPHAKGIHLREIHRQQSHLRAIRLSSSLLGILYESLQVKIAISVAIHNQETTTIALIINTLQRSRRSQDIGQFHPDLLEPQGLARHHHLVGQVMGVCM